MDLKNGRVTIGEILQNPNARSMIQRSRYSMLLNSPMVGQFRNMPLQDALNQAGRFLPPNVINKAVARLREL